jgi:argininosuccinate synthase
MRTLGEALIMEAVEGRWFRGLRKALQSFLEVSAHRVSGEVRFTLRNGGFELAGLKAVSPLYIRDRERWEYAKAAAARSVTTSRFDGSSILTEQGRGTGLGRRGEWLDAGLQHRPNGEKALQVRESLPRDAAAHRLSPEHRLPAPPGDPNSTTSLD